MLAVLDGKLRLLDFIRYASLDGLGTFREADADAELALMDTRTMLGRTYSLKERRWVEKGEQSELTEDSIYELAYSFSDNHRKFWLPMAASRRTCRYFTLPMQRLR